MKAALFSISLVFLASVDALIVCPQNACALMDCAPLTDCLGTVKQGGGMCGCCDTCVSTLNEGDYCGSVFLLGVPSNTECGKGLHCDPHTSRCARKHTRATGPCAAAHSTYLLGVQQHLIGATEPKCDSDGFYLPKQCQGSVCTCVSKEGKQIQGYEAHVWEAQNMNCQCARDQQEYMATGLIGRMFYCTDNGNYQTYQCFGSVCHCTDQNGMIRGTQSVNIGDLNQLDCSK